LQVIKHHQYSRLGKHGKWPVEALTDVMYGTQNTATYPSTGTLVSYGSLHLNNDIVEQMKITLAETYRTYCTTEYLFVKVFLTKKFLEARLGSL